MREWKCVGEAVEFAFRPLREAGSANQEVGIDPVAAGTAEPDVAVAVLVSVAVNAVDAVARLASRTERKATVSIAQFNTASASPC